MIGVTGNLEDCTGADTGISEKRAEQWLRISELISFGSRRLRPATCSQPTWATS